MESYLLKGVVSIDNNWKIEDLEVYSRTQDLLHKFYPRLINYPKSEKFSLAQHIKENFFEILKNVSLGNSVKSKRLAYLQTADGHLQVLKALMKLSKERKYISQSYYEIVSLELRTINKLLSGYIKSVNKK